MQHPWSCPLPTSTILKQDTWVLQTGIPQGSIWSNTTTVTASVSGGPGYLFGFTFAGVTVIRRTLSAGTCSYCTWSLDPVDM